MRYRALLPIDLELLVADDLLLARQKGIVLDDALAVGGQVDDDVVAEESAEFLERHVLGLRDVEVDDHCGDEAEAAVEEIHAPLDVLEG